MEKYFFSNILLVPFPSEKNYTFYWVGTLYDNNSRTEVIAFNTNEPAKFQPMLKTDLTELMHIRRQGSRHIGHLKLNGQDTADEIARMRNIKKQIRFIKRTLTELSNELFIKQPKQLMLDMTAERLNIRLTPNQVIFLSGVSGIIKD